MGVTTVACVTICALIIAAAFVAVVNHAPITVDGRRRREKETYGMAHNDAENHGSRTVFGKRTCENESVHFRLGVGGRTRSPDSALEEAAAAAGAMLSS